MRRSNAAAFNRAARRAWNQANSVPASVSESLIPEHIGVKFVDRRLCYVETADAHTLREVQLSGNQLHEVALVYNAWRDGELVRSRKRDEK